MSYMPSVFVSMHGIVGGIVSGGGRWVKFAKSYKGLANYDHSRSQGKRHIKKKKKIRIVRKDLRNSF